MTTKSLQPSLVKHRLHLPEVLIKKYRQLIGLPRFNRAYIVVSLIVRLRNTLFWALLGVRIQQGNADQIVDTSLFGSAATFHGAASPNTHSYLLKWPIFFLINVFGASNTISEIFTVATVLLTVLFLVLFLYRIERRPFVFATICLALASVLLLIPAEPYAGGILPVNMAMLTTRNLEYIVYIASLVLLLRSPKLKSWSFWVATVSMGVLFASDKLFLAFSIGGALLALIIYARYQRWNYVSSSINWLILGVIAAAIGSGILIAINASAITHTSSQSTVSPYGLSSSAHGVVLGSIYAVLGLLTNFGANPAYDAKLVKSIPHELLSHFMGAADPAYIVNLGVLVVGLIVTFRLIRTSFIQRSDPNAKISKAATLVMMLSATTIIAFFSFILTNHYYVVDARYLAVSLFAVFIAMATYARTNRHWRPEQFAWIGMVLLISIAFGMVAAERGYKADMGALNDQNNRNSQIVEVLAQHPVSTLVGDYWRVLPIKLASNNTLNVTPLANCTQLQKVLTSNAWQPDLNRTNFAYLLTFDGSLTNYPNCTIQQVVSAYGRPNGSTLIEGNFSHPKELLLFYDQGIRKASAAHPPLTKEPTTVLPIAPSALPNISCSGPSSMNIVAHQDDDILFMNPDIMHDIQMGYCVRTVYVTAGDDGGGKFYWLSREQGSEAAYAAMLGVPDIWVQRTVELSVHEYVIVANIRGNTKISLIFMNLPDGNLQGQGFSASNHESLAKLESGRINTLHTVDGQSYYSSTQLTDALDDLIDIYQTSLIRTLASYISLKFPDHSDHVSVGWYVKQAYKQYESQQYANRVVIPLEFYIGYPIHALPANVSGAQLSQKEMIFLTYAKYDSHVCQTQQSCKQTPTYAAYLAREYQNVY